VSRYSGAKSHITQSHTQDILKCVSSSQESALIVSHHTYTHSRYSQSVRQVLHSQPCSYTSHLHTLTIFSSAPRDILALSHTSHTQVILKGLSRYSSAKSHIIHTHTQVTHHTYTHSRYSYLCEKFSSPPAPMNHVKDLRAGLAKMPFQNWYTAHTNHFHLTDSVRSKSKNQLG